MRKAAAGQATGWPPQDPTCKHGTKGQVDLDSTFPRAADGHSGRQPAGHNMLDMLSLARAGRAQQCLHCRTLSACRGKIWADIYSSSTTGRPGGQGGQLCFF